MEGEVNWPEDFMNKIICGDCLEVIKEMPDKSVDMAITSPPYWGLRDYGNEQIFGGNGDCKHTWGVNPIEHDALRYRGHNANVGSNKNPEIHQGKEKSGGQDCIYCGAWKGQLGLEPTPELYIEHLTEIFNEVKRILKKEGTFWLNIGDTYSATRWSDTPSTTGISAKCSDVVLEKQTDLPQKCLCMIPERLAWSLIQNGWILRNKIIWRKKNHMPSSVKDRFSNCWEYIFLFSKSQRYYFDLDAVREPHQYPDDVQRRMRQDAEEGVKPFKKGTMEARHRKGLNVPGQLPHGIHRKRHSGYFGADGEYLVNPGGKNPGDVFEINTQPFPEAHFAVFPEKLCEKPIKAGCPEGGIVLDPFCGAGTALYVAKEMKRRFIGIDIKDEYCDMAEKRLAQGVL